MVVYDSIAKRENDTRTSWLSNIGATNSSILDETSPKVSPIQHEVAGRTSRNWLSIMQRTLAMPVHCCVHFTFDTNVVASDVKSAWK